MLQLTLLEGQAGFGPGVPAEIESGSMLYLGEVRQTNGSNIKILVEHSLDQTRLSSLQETWR
jgi:hypothetical protein